MAILRANRRGAPRWPAVGSLLRRARRTASRPRPSPRLLSAAGFPPIWGPQSPGCPTAARMAFAGLAGCLWWPHRRCIVQSVGFPPQAARFLPPSTRPFVSGGHQAQPRGCRQCAEAVCSIVTGRQWRARVRTAPKYSAGTHCASTTALEPHRLDWFGWQSIGRFQMVHNEPLRFCLLLLSLTQSLGLELAPIDTSLLLRVRR